MNEEMDPLSSTTDGKHRHSTSTVGAAQNRGGGVMKRPGADEGVGISLIELLEQCEGLEDDGMDESLTASQDPIP
ncbi:hypothetical protein CSOJ01_08276 [Colletotrichum sojae]|uniref:Uncharacterized protein n=1 Tax=Colletotrichum sojae TaxID=2175907 RepID=A0A8H6J6K2_9PEZI|nr:hypothetical protein CSOJ01_08276 [Colletotrichum sojae]